MPLQPTSVLKVPLPFTNEELSAGAINGSRIAIPHADDAGFEAFIGTKGKIFRVRAGTPPTDSLMKGKDSVYIPAEAHDASVQLFEPISFPDSEIQSLSVARDSSSVRLLACDDYGCVSIASTSHAAPQWTHAYSLKPQRASGTQQGWCGASASVENINMVALARHLARDVHVFEGENILFRLGTMYYPSAVQFLTAPAAASLVAVAEGPQVSLFDVRAGGKAVQRLVNGSSHSDILALSQTTDGGFLGVIGRDRSVSVWETRNWKLEEKTSNVVKYEATAMHFSTVQPDLCFCAGLDYEVWGGLWKKPEPVQATKKRERPEPTDGAPVGRAVGPASVLQAIDREATTGDVNNAGPGSAGSPGFGLRVSGRSMGLAIARVPGQDAEVLAAFNGSSVYFCRLQPQQGVEAVEEMA